MMKIHWLYTQIILLMQSCRRSYWVPFLLFFSLIPFIIFSFPKTLLHLVIYTFFKSTSIQKYMNNNGFITKIWLGKQSVSFYRLATQSNGTIWRCGLRNESSPQRETRGSLTTMCVKTRFALICNSAPIPHPLTLTNHSHPCFSPN